MKKSLAVTLIAIAALLSATPSASATRPVTPTQQVKATIDAGVKKVERYVANHDGAVPRTARGNALVASKNRNVHVAYLATVGPIDKPGYCIGASHESLHGNRVWLYDSWLSTLTLSSQRDVKKSDGACHFALWPSHTERRQAIDTARLLGVSTEAYLTDHETLPESLDPVIAALRVRVPAGTQIVDYAADPDAYTFRFCVTRKSGAWAVYESTQGGVTHSGATGATCKF